MTATDELFTERFRALRSRDSRFDGQFIAGVHSTGIYCRPSCPAMTPLERNVVFYRTAAAAHDAGLRACKRCLPDAVPGSPEWNIRDDLASRAMRLIADGVIEREGVTGLASRLGYTTRHLTRVLVAELGAGPLALARANRAQSARALLTGTSLPVADVAFAAGFASIRQFNDTVRAVYQLTPTELRTRATGVPRADSGRSRGKQHNNGPVDLPAGHSLASDATTISLRLPARAPFDGPGLMRFFADHAISGLEHATDAVYERMVALPHGRAYLSVRLDGTTGVACTARLEHIDDVAALVARVRRLFDLDADSASIDAALSHDPALAPLVAARPGTRLPGSLDAHEALFRTLVGQQISVAAARTVLARITHELGTDGLFPTAAQIAEGGAAVLRGPARRVASIIAVARALASGELHLDVGMPLAEFTARLEALPGVGPWTAGYLAIRVLGSPNVFLPTDLVLQQSAARMGLPSSARDLSAYAQRWAPWGSYAALHLWRARASLPSVYAHTPDASPQRPG